MRAALIRQGVVENVIIISEEHTYVPEEEVDMVILESDSLVSIGWTLEGGVFSPPQEAPE